MTTPLFHGSMLLVFGWLVVGGLGLPVPEDAALLATGALVYHHAIAPAVALVLVFVGVLAGDTTLFLLARWLGPAAYQRRLFRRLLPPERRIKFEMAYRRHGGKLVFMARHVMGLRAATFALAGIHGMSLRRFLFWDALAACLSVPLIVGLGYLGALHLDQVRSDIALIEGLVLVAVIVSVAGFLVARRVRARRRRGPAR